MRALQITFLLLLLSIASFGQGIYNQATASGTNTYTATVTPTFTGYYEGQKFTIKFTNANSGASTININGKGAKSLVKEGSTALTAGDIKAGEIKFLVYDGTNMQVVGGGSVDEDAFWKTSGTTTLTTTSPSTNNVVNIPHNEVDAFTIKSTNTYLKWTTTTTGPFVTLGNSAGPLSRNIVLKYSGQPTSNSAWDDLSVPTKKYVDDTSWKISGESSILTSSSIITGSSGTINILTSAASDGARSSILVDGANETVALKAFDNVGENLSLAFISDFGSESSAVFTDSRTVKKGIEVDDESYGTDYTDKSFIHRKYADSRYVISTRTIAGVDLQDNITASEFRTALGVLTTVVLPSDDTNNNATPDTLEDLDGLSFPVISGESYYFRVFVVYTAPAATGSRFTLTGPSFTRLGAWYENTLTATSATVRPSVDDYGTPSASGATSSAEDVSTVKIEGTIKAADNGTVKVQFASEVAGSPITALGGLSIIQYMRIQ